MSKPVSIERGTYKIIRVEGTEEIFDFVPNMRRIQQQIGAPDTLDTVILTRYGRTPDLVMIVDDTGMIDNRPVNPKATELYRSVCKPVTVYSIHGDVAIIHDGDIQ